MAEEPWTCFDERGRSHVTAEMLSSTIVDLDSWYNFLRMMTTNIPAVMTMHRDDGASQKIVVVRTKYTNRSSTMLDPYGRQKPG